MRRLLLGLAVTALPALALAQTLPAPAFRAVTIGGFLITGVGTTTGTVAAGNDSRITGALQAGNNLADLPSIAVARTNLGLGSLATQSASAVTVTGGTLNGVTIGNTTPGPATFTAITGPLTGNASTATALATARTFTLSGDVAGSATFDGSANPTITATLAASGVTSGSYGTSTAVPALTVDGKGRVTAAGNTAISLSGLGGAPLASPTFTGTVTIPSGASISGFAPLASPALTGAPTVPTAAADTNTTQAASTSFVLGQLASATPLVNGAASVGSATRAARADHVHPTDTSRAASSVTVTGIGMLTGGGALTGNQAITLAPQAAGTVLANVTGGSAVATAATPSAILDGAIGSTRGTVAIRGASTWGAAVPSTSGQTLQFNGTDTTFAAASPGAGAVRYDTGQTLTAAQQSQAQSNVGLGVPWQPSGRLTLLSGTPIMSGSTSGSSVLWTPYNGNLLPIWNGSAFTPMASAELSNVLANSSSGSAGPAAAVAGMGYDLFVWSNAGTLTLTRGPAWTAGATAGTWTAGGGTCARGSGAGSTALTRVQGIDVNAVAITNGPGAGAGTYVGTIMTDTSGATVTWNPGSSTAGGGAAWLGIWNRYNRVATTALVQDTNQNHTYSSATVRAFAGSTTWRATFVRGLDDEPVAARFESAFQLAGGNGQVSIGLNSTSARASAATTSIAGASLVSLLALFEGKPGLGAGYLQALEASDGTNANTFYGGGYGLLAVAGPM